MKRKQKSTIRVQGRVLDEFNQPPSRSFYFSSEINKGCNY